MIHGCKITEHVDQKPHLLLHLINWTFSCIVSFSVLKSTLKKSPSTLEVSFHIHV